MAVGHLKSFEPIMEILAEAAVAGANAARRRFRERPPIPRGAALRPGLQTPLWNELALAVRRSFRRRGDKVRLARYLGVSRQRLHLLLVAGTACPDAERALQLLIWLQSRSRGVDLDR